MAKVLRVSLCSDATVEAGVNGIYKILGYNHGRPMYKGGEEGDGYLAYLYFWDDRDGDDMCGWWIGPTLGGEDVWVYHEDKQAAVPPVSGWHAPHDGLIDLAMRVEPEPLSSFTGTVRPSEGQTNMNPVRVSATRDESKALPEDPVATKVEPADVSMCNWGVQDDASYQSEGKGNQTKTVPTARGIPTMPSEIPPRRLLLNGEWELAARRKHPAPFVDSQAAASSPVVSEQARVLASMDFQPAGPNEDDDVESGASQPRRSDEHLRSPCASSPLQPSDKKHMPGSPRADPGIVPVRSHSAPTQEHNHWSSHEAARSEELLELHRQLTETRKQGEEQMVQLLALQQRMEQRRRKEEDILRRIHELIAPLTGRCLYMRATPLDGRS